MRLLTFQALSSISRRFKSTEVGTGRITTDSSGQRGDRHSRLSDIGKRDLWELWDRGTVIFKFEVPPTSAGKIVLKERRHVGVSSKQVWGKLFSTTRALCSEKRHTSTSSLVEAERDTDDQVPALVQESQCSLEPSPRQIAPHSQQAQVQSPKLLVGRVCRILWSTKWGQGTEEALQELNIYFTPSLVNEVLRCQQDVDVALGYFQFVKSQPHYKHNARTHAKIFSLLGAARRYDELQQLSDSIRRDGCRLDTELFNTLISVYGEANLTDKALKLLADYSREGGQPTAYTYGSLIQVFMKGGDVQHGKEMYSQMLQARVLPDHTTFNILIDGLAKAGQVSSCLEFESF